MAIRKSDDLENESDSRYNNVKTAKAREKITERFDDSTHNEQISDEALQFLNKKIDECIDEINASDSSKIITSAQASAISANTAKVGTTSTERSRIAANHSKVGITTSQASAITANTSKTGITSTQASRITANTSKVGTETNLCTTEEITLRATVLNSRGTYTLKFTMTHGETTKTATLALK